MGFNINGYVLRPARVAVGNAVSTGEATSGVSRDHISPSQMTALGYAIAPSRAVEPYADMYRAAVLSKPTPSKEEYIVWAATTGSLSIVDSDAFEISGDPDFVTPARGALTVGSFSEGTDTFFVEDGGGRDLSEVLTLVMVRGDNSVSVTGVFASQDPLIGRVVLNSGALILLSGGFSVERGDTVLSVSYTLSPPKFWWSRNDANNTRFGWQGKSGRWAPFKGSTPQNLGSVSEGESYKLGQPVTRFSVGGVLPGDPLLPDRYALIRSGTFPDSSGKPLSVLVVSEEDVSSTYPSAGLLYDAVVGVSSGILLLNPSYVSTNSGLTLWYNTEVFSPSNRGDLGALKDLPTDSNLGFPCLSPVPGPTERPFLRLGFRRYLSPVAVDTDADLPLPSGVTERSFYWSRSTGKIVLSGVDINRSVSDQPEYEISYLDAHVFYDGVSLSSQPVSTQRPSPAIDASGDDLIGVDAGGSGIPGSGNIFIKRSVPLPPPGASGVLFVPDGSGQIPNLTIDPETRPNGSGLRRDLAGIGDTFLFSSTKAFEDLVEEEYDEDLPVLPLKVKKTEAVVSRMAAVSQPTGHTDASRIQIKRRGIQGEALYFLQAQVTPAVYSEEARLYSRVTDSFTLSGDETLRFNIDGSTYVWDASVNLGDGVFTAQQIADDINLSISGTGQATVVRGSIVLESGSISSGQVEIGWNVDPEDLSGHSALGFLPGWRVDASGSEFRWQPDNGAAIGLYRSPENLDRSGMISDIKAVGKFDGVVLTESIPGTPFFSISNPPLEDIPGYDDGSHFSMSLGLNVVQLSNYGVNQDIGVKYDWINDRFIWTEKGSLGPTAVTSLTSSLQLPDPNVLPETVSSLAMAPTGSGYGLYFKAVGSLSYLELDFDNEFSMPGSGAPGQALLISPEGTVVTSGGGGAFSVAGSFSNPNLSPIPAQDLVLQMDLIAKVDVGNRLQILNGDGAGLYTITGKAFVPSIATFSVSPAFSVADYPVSWRILEGQTSDVYDPTIIADIQQVPFNHLPEEPWKIRVLSAIGTVGAPLFAVVSDALTSNREVQIRFDLTQPPDDQTSSVSYLETGAGMGSVSGSDMKIPDTSDTHFTNSGVTAYFQIRVGVKKFNSALSNLTLVSSFSVTVPSGTVEVGENGSGIEGSVRFASDMISGLEGESVYYDQIFLSNTLLSAGTSEVDPNTGAVNLSLADLTVYAGQTAYLVEQMVTEQSLDVTISPINGSILFNKPLRAGQVVESEYLQANSSGEPVNTALVEYLPLTVRLEEASVVSGDVYSFNPTGKTLGARGSEFVWVGSVLQNFAGVNNVAVNDDSTISFNSPVPSGSTVKINYSVLEAFGGEQAYTISHPPVYRAPFFLEKDQDTFTLEMDRTNDIVVGQLGVLGGKPFYIKAVSSASDQTSVTIWPPPLTEMGSRAPGRDAGFFLSSSQVAIIVDPEDPVAGNGSEGFLASVDTSSNPFLPADVGQTSITFTGDLTRFARVNHLLEIGGYPHIIIGSSLSEGGRYTIVNLSNPLYKAFDTATDDVRLSVRALYAPEPVEFEGISPFQESSGIDLFLIGSEVDGVEVPGVQLVEGIHFEADPGTGRIIFKSPNQSPLKPGEKLVASYVATDQVGPVVQNGSVISPFYKSQYLHLTVPSTSNRILGSTLSAKYTFSNPDTFYFETLTLEEYLGTVAKVALSKVSGSSRSGGAVSAYTGATVNSSQGGLGLRGNVRDLKDQDRAARAYIELYNGVCLAFEQILEAVDGRIIGDRDGKFRFFVGHNRNYASPGFEDPISGDLTKRLVWREIVDEWSTASILDGYYIEEDPVFDPVTAFEKDPADRPGETDGKAPNPNTLAFYTSLQRTRIKNDMDDRVLVGLGRPRGLSFLLPAIDVPGLFKDMWEPHVFSRLFPERAKHFSRLFPGLEAVQSSVGGFSDPGFFSSGRKLTVDGPNPGEVTEQTVKTSNSPIGSIANPAMGTIKGVVDVSARDRFPRARVLTYYPEGSAELDAALLISTVGKATLIATPLSLGEFPSTNTGFPDATQLMSQGGDLFDLVSGDVDLSTPGFEIGQRLKFGTPEGPQGTFYELTDAAGDGIFIGEVLVGCVITMADKNGDPVTGVEVLVNGVTQLSQIASRGDTIFVGPPVMDLANVPASTDAPTLDQISALSDSLPEYRIQFDIGVAKRSGEFLDNSLSIREDVFPLPLQNMLGQKPPRPLTCIEGTVEFVNVEQSPLKLPALKGEEADDSGDVQIPYMKGSDTELTVLGQAANDIQVLLNSDTAFGIPYLSQVWKAVYPDEIVISDGQLHQLHTLAPNRDPATLYTDSDLTPVATAGVYTSFSGVGDVRSFDLILVQVDQPLVTSGALLEGMTGILSVGASSGFFQNGSFSKAEPPRFVSHATRGAVHRYTVENAFGYVSGTYPATSGLIMTSSVLLGVWTTLLNFSSISGLVFDSNGGLAGGLLALLPAGPPFNAVIIKFYDPDPTQASGGSFLGSIVIPTRAAAGVIYVFDAVGAVVTPITLTGTGVDLAAPNIIRIRSTAPVSAALPAIPLGSYFDTTVGVDTYINSVTSSLSGGALVLGSAPGSTSCEISADRLTFNERVSFSSALPRGSTPANGEPTELGVSVSVEEVTVGAGAGCTVNAPSEVNGGSPFTIQSRVGPDPDLTVPTGDLYVGTFVTGAPGSENGKLRMMSWEGFGNTPLPFLSTPTNGIILSSVPSSNLNEVGVILEGSGTMRDSVPIAGYTQDGSMNRIDNITVGSGAIQNVEPGDIVVVVDDGAGEGVVKEGTYLVRHSVGSNASSFGGQPLLSVAHPTDAGGVGFLDLTFPKVLSISTLSLIAESVVSVPYSSTGCGFPDPGTSPYVYLILKDQYSSYAAGTYTVDPASVYRMRYSSLSFDPSGEATFTLVTGTAEDATGSPISDAIFQASATRGVQVSGMTYLPVSPQSVTGLPENNVLGWDQDSTPTALTAGFLMVIAGNINAKNHGGAGGTSVTSKIWDKASSLGDIRRLLANGSAPPAGTLGVRVPIPENSTEFYDSRNAAIYGRLYLTASASQDAISGVPAHISLEGMTASNWNDIHFDAASGILPGDHRLRCLLPGDRLMTGDDLLTPTIPGFWALSGVFLEPSFPRPTTDLSLASPHVVANSWPLTGQTGQVGSRDVSNFVGAAVTETVGFNVRRIRRFHQVQNRIAETLGQLKFVYEMRRGDFGSYNTSTRVFTAGTLTYGEATNVGSFSNRNVNINAGDEIRVLNGEGVLLDSAEIQRVSGDLTLTLRRPGLTKDLASAASFEIYLQQAIVPHEQSSQQLLNLVSDQTIVRRVVDYGAIDTDGGRVPTAFNVMQDTLIPNWSLTSVRAGDYVVVDPSGPLYVSGESGSRAFGDTSVPGRSPHVAGGPSRLDDNRGFYKVVSTNGADLVVEGSSRFSGGFQDGSDDQIFGDAGAEYAVLPVVNGSTLTSTDPSYPYLGGEGQQALRPTSAAVSNSFLDRTGFNEFKSIEPFGYTIIRPSSMFSTDALELVLFNRERILSLIEEMKSVYNGRGGDYYVFQRDDHIEDVGSPVDASVGLGVVSNLVVSNLEGLVTETPFANVSDCLSILDRRFWVLDFRLDAPGYTDFVDDGLGQRPVLPDLVDDALNLDDRFRDLRYSWISFRANRINGSITTARRAEDQLPEDLRKQRELVAQRAGLDNS